MFMVGLVASLPSQNYGRVVLLIPNRDFVGGAHWTMVMSLGMMRKKTTLSNQCSHLFKESSGIFYTRQLSVIIRSDLWTPHVSRGMPREDNGFLPGGIGEVVCPPWEVHSGRV